MATAAEVREAGLHAVLQAASQMEGDEHGHLSEEDWAFLECIVQATQEEAAEESNEDDAAFAFDESKHHRGQPGNKGEFGSGGGAATTGAQARKKNKRLPVQPTAAKAPLAARVAGALARSGEAIIATGYGVPREKLAGLIAHVPSAMRAPVGNLWHAVHGVLMAGNTVTKALARQVMKDKGLDDAQIAKLAWQLGAVDLGFQGTMMATATAAAIGAIPALVLAAKAASYCPVASAAYILHSSASPAKVLATMNSALTLLKEKFPDQVKGAAAFAWGAISSPLTPHGTRKPHVEHASFAADDGRNDATLLADAYAAAEDGDWWLALFSVAFDDVRNVAQAVEMANACTSAACADASFAFNSSQPRHGKGERGGQWAPAGRTGADLHAGILAHVKARPAAGQREIREAMGHPQDHPENPVHQALDELSRAGKLHTVTSRKGGRPLYSLPPESPFASRKEPAAESERPPLTAPKPESGGEEELTAAKKLIDGAAAERLKIVRGPAGPDRVKNMEALQARIDAARAVVKKAQERSAVKPPAPPEGAGAAHLAEKLKGMGVPSGPMADPAVKPGATPAEHQVAVMTAVNRARPGRPVDLAALHVATGLSVPDLHAAVQALRRAGKLTGNSKEKNFSTADRLTAIHEPGGTPIHQVSLREEDGGHGPAVPEAPDPAKVAALASAIAADEMRPLHESHVQKALAWLQPGQNLRNSAQAGRAFKRAGLPVPSASHEEWRDAPFSNEAHEPAGSPEGGRFAKKDGGSIDREASKLVRDAQREATPKTESKQKRAYHGEIGPNGEEYPGGAFIATTDMPKKVKQKIEKTAGRSSKEQLDGDTWAEVPIGQMPIFRLLGAGTTFNHRDGGSLNHEAMQYYGVSSERQKAMVELLEKYKAGERLVSMLDYPKMAGMRDVARSFVAGEAIPGEAMEEQPQWLKDAFSKYTPKESKPTASEPKSVQDMTLKEWEDAPFSKDAAGHEHKGAGPGGGEFTSSGGGGGKSSEKEPKKAGKEKAPPEKEMSEKALRAKAAHVLIDKDIQRYAEEHNEPRFAKVVGGVSLPDSEPYDVGTDDDSIELKTLVANGNGKLTMDKYAQVRKIVHEKESGKTFHTVVSDDTLVKDANGPGKHDDDKRKYFYRRGVAGSARIGAMLKVESEEELLRLMAAPEDELPDAAKRTDGKLRVGKWKFVATGDRGAGYYVNKKTGEEAHPKK